MEWLERAESAGLSRSRQYTSRVHGKSLSSIHRIVGDLAVLEAFQDPAEAQRRQVSRHRAEPLREILLTDAGWETLDIEETRWAGIRNAG